jgi:serine/threonine protein kinase
MSGLPLNSIVANKYRIEERIGAGGMGEVYRATNLQTSTPVAVKALTETRESETALLRFRNEAVIQYRLHHPNVAELYEYFECHGKPCIAMEFVEGRTLDEWIRETGGLEPGKALEIIADICDAVSYMHSKGTIHRDIKSENIRVNAQNKAKLLDFGISVSRDTPAFTRAGCAIGTPEKMAPEQHQGLRGDARSDVWALGVLLYEMLTGALPFANPSPAGLREDVVGVRYIPAAKRKSGLPKPVLKVISTCLQRKPDDRYASGGVMLREVQLLRRRLTSEKWRQVVFSKPAAAVAALVTLLVSLFAYALRPTGNVPSPGGEENTDAAAVSRASSNGTPDAGGSTQDRASVLTTSQRRLPDPNPASKPPPKLSSPSSLQSEPYSMPDGSATTQKTVRVATYDGPAEVTNRDGQVLGYTPYPLTGPFGQSYELWLRRPGFQPRQIDVQINNKSEYLFGLERIEGRSDFGKKE